MWVIATHKDTKKLWCRPFREGQRDSYTNFTIKFVKKVPVWYCYGALANKFDRYGWILKPKEEK